MKKRPHNFVDITGQQFGRLVIEKRGPNAKGNKATWLCKCECGRLITVPTNTLKSGRTRSCGCLRNELSTKRRWGGYEEISLDFWTIIRRGAATRNLELNITIEFAWELFLQQNRKCALTGRILTFKNPITKCKTRTASLDRIDSHKGYIQNNVQWVHKTLNMCKWTLHNNEFIEIGKEVAKHHD